MMDAKYIVKKDGRVLATALKSDDGYVVIRESGCSLGEYFEVLSALMDIGVEAV